MYTKDSLELTRLPVSKIKDLLVNGVNRRHFGIDQTGQFGVHHLPASKIIRA